MNLKRMVAATTLAAGVGTAGLFGIGLGTAAANPGPPCNGPGNSCQQPGGPQHDNGPQGDHQGPQGGPQGPQGPQDGPRGPQDGPAPWLNRGIDQARNDHQPFNWHGQQVQPLPAGNGNGWGFWFLGVWIPL
jgi:hypothetical protein